MMGEMEDIFLKHSIKITEMKNTKSDRETTSSGGQQLRRHRRDQGAEGEKQKSSTMKHTEKGGREATRPRWPGAHVRRSEIPLPKLQEASRSRGREKDI